MITRIIFDITWFKYLFRFKEYIGIGTFSLIGISNNNQKREKNNITFTARMNTFVKNNYFINTYLGDYYHFCFL